MESSKHSSLWVVSDNVTSDFRSVPWCAICTIASPDPSEWPQILTFKVCVCTTMKCVSLSLKLQYRQASWKNISVHPRVNYLLTVGSVVRNVFADRHYVVGSLRKFWKKEQKIMLCSKFMFAFNMRQMNTTAVDAEIFPGGGCLFFKASLVHCGSSSSLCFFALCGRTCVKSMSKH